MPLGNLVVKFSADVTSLQDGFTAAQKAANKLADGLSNVGTKLTIGLTAPLALLATSVVGAAAEMDGLQRGLSAVAGSAEETQRQLGRLQDVAKLPGLGFREAIQGSTSLQAAGFSANVAEKALRAFGNALATVGRGKADLNAVTTQLTQIASKGKISAEEINTISERVPQVRKAMQAAFGTVDTQALQKSGISAIEFVTRLSDELLKLPQVTGGVGNAFENMSDALFRARAAIGDALLPAVIPLVDGLAALLTKVREVNPDTLRTVAAFAAVAAAAGPLALGISGVITAVTALSTALSIGLLPLILAGGPILIALALLAAAFVKTGLDALAAAADAEAAAARFKAALAAMNDATLSGTLEAKEANTNALIRSRNSLQAQVDSLRASVPKEPAGSRGLSARVGGAPSAGGRALQEAARRQNETLSNNAAAYAQIRQKEGLISNLNQMIADRSTELSAISGELNARQSHVVAPPPLNLSGAGATDKLRGVRDTVDDLVRSLATLQRFGVTDIEVLPEGVQDKIHAFEQLRNEADRLGDALNRMGAAAPRAGIDALARLRASVVAADEEISALATNFTRAFREMGEKTVSTVITVSLNPLSTRDIGASVNASLGLDDFGRSLTATGKLLGDFGGPLPLVSAGLSLLRESALQAGRTLLAALQTAAGAGGQFAGNLVNHTAKLMENGKSLSAAGPAAFAFATAMEVATGFFEALQPALEALTLPLRIMGEVLSMLIVPVLRILFPVFKAVAIVVSFFGEMVARIVGAILNAAGGFVKGLGKLINAITPFANPGNPLVKAGEAMQKTAHQFSEAADDMKEKRRELQNLTFEDALSGAASAADKLSDSLSNVPPIFDIALRRIQASRGVAQTTSSALNTASAVAASPAPAISSGGTTVQLIFAEGAVQGGAGANARDVASEFVRMLVSKLSTASDSDARDLAATLRLAGV